MWDQVGLSKQYVAVGYFVMFFANDSSERKTAIFQLRVRSDPIGYSVNHCTRPPLAAYRIRPTYCLRQWTKTARFSISMIERPAKQLNASESMACTWTHRVLDEWVISLEVSFVTPSAAQQRRVFRIWQRRGHGERVPGALVGGSVGHLPLKLKHFFLLNVQWKPQIRPFFSEIWKRRKSQRDIRCNLTWRF